IHMDDPQVPPVHIDDPQVPPVTSKVSSIPLLGCIIDFLVHLCTFSSTTFSDKQEKKFIDVAVEENRAAHKHFRQHNSYYVKFSIWSKKSCQPLPGISQLCLYES
ncbi:hypothetical protein HID58_005463, partial [Brassica napus]